MATAEASLSDARGKLFAKASTTCLIFDVPINRCLLKNEGGGDFVKTLISGLN
jgi:hypothetical protein